MHPLRRLLPLLLLTVACSGDGPGEPDPESDAGEPAGCMPDSFRCVGSDIQRCNLEGSDWTYYRTCEAPSTCSEGRCVGGDCGNGTCDGAEDCNACPEDCGCSETDVCDSSGDCVACPDDDSDGICNADDVCPGEDDALDDDGDGVPDGCDVCPGENDALDDDGDGVPDGCDVCPGEDETDPSFDEGFEMPSAWETESGATIVDGEATFPAAGSAVRAPICLAPVPASVGFGFTARAKWVSSGAGGTEPRLGLDALLDGVVFGRDQETLHDASEDTFETLHMCVGERWYGGAFPFDLQRTGSGDDYAIVVDEVGFDASDSACPAVGEVMNGDVESLDGWFANHSSVPVADEDGNQVIHMHFPSGCTDGTANIVGTTASFPVEATLPDAAIRLRVKGDLSGTSNAFQIRLEYGDTQDSLDSITTLSSDWSTETYCIPEDAKGLAGDIVFAIPVDCGDGFREMYVDDVEIVSDAAACP